MPDLSEFTVTHDQLADQFRASLGDHEGTGDTLSEALQSLVYSLEDSDL